jgi:two-component system chemotaxis response regulator CheY
MTHKVLLIDDSRTMRAVLKVYLMGGTYEFIEADSAARALDVLRVVTVDLIIADVNLPHMDGIAFVRHIRSSEQARLRDVPIIVITSDKSEDLPARSASAHADAFLTKPVQAEVLAETVARLVRSKLA